MVSNHERPTSGQIISRKKKEKKKTVARINTNEQSPDCLDEHTSIKALKLKNVYSWENLPSYSQITLPSSLHNKRICTDLLGLLSNFSLDCVVHDT